MSRTGLLLFFLQSPHPRRRYQGGESALWLCSTTTSYPTRVKHWFKVLQGNQETFYVLGTSYFNPFSNLSKFGVNTSSAAFGYRSETPLWAWRAEQMAGAYTCGTNWSLCLMNSWSLQFWKSVSGVWRPCQQTNQDAKRTYFCYFLSSTTEENGHQLTDQNLEVQIFNILRKEGCMTDSFGSAWEVKALWSQRRFDRAWPFFVLSTVCPTTE